MRSLLVHCARTNDTFLINTFIVHQVVCVFLGGVRNLTGCKDNWCHFERTNLFRVQKENVNCSNDLCSGASRAPVRVMMGIKAALPKYEIYFYNTVLFLAVLWSASWISEVSSCEY